MSLDFADLDQKLFGWLFRFGRRLASRGPRASRVSFVDLEARLTLIASAVAERRIRLVAVDGNGSVGIDEIRLPRHLDTLGTTDENRALYLLRTMLDASMLRLPVRAAPNMDDVTRRLAALLLVPWLVQELARELPGMARTMAALRAPMTRALEGSSAGSESRDSLIAATRFAIGASTHGDELLDESTRQGLVGTSPLGIAFRTAQSLANRRSASRASADVLPLISPFPLVESTCAPGTALEARASAPGAGGKATTERDAPARDGVRRVVLKPFADDNPLVHSFEKVHTAENYRGGEKSVDGSDELEDHGEALDELDLREVIRTDATAHSIYRADLVTLDVASAPKVSPVAEPGSIFYDEWAGDRYRSDYCRLVVSRAQSPDPRSPAVVVRADRAERVRRVFESIEDLRRLRPRQPVGSEIDVDAMVDRYASVRAGVEGGDRVYADRRAVENDVATLVLVDMSHSSDGYLRGKHVLSIEREATAALGDALDRIGSSFAVAGFFSRTHADCRFVVVKDFADPWTTTRPRLASLVPDGYTRIGAAIRHGSTMLGQVRARKRALFLFTDGRPTDYDAYEGRYGIADVRMAFHECERNGVLPFAFCVAERRSSQLRAMFGARGYESLSDPDELADRLFVAEARLRRRS